MLIGILADTHIPYRASCIPNAVLEAFRDVDLILHAGDVDESWALQPLKKIAPVLAVSGNYHIFDRSSGGKHLPSSEKVTLCGSTIVITHGHQMGWTSQFWRLITLISSIMGKFDSPLRDQFISKRLLRQYPEADIIVFGHSHRYYTYDYNGTLVINPGAACASSYFNVMPETTVALLTLESGKIPCLQRVNLAL